MEMKDVSPEHTLLSTVLSLDPMIFRGSHNEMKINKADPKSNLICRRYSWTGEAARTTLSSDKQCRAGKRPSTATSTGRKAPSKIELLDSKTNSDLALYPLFKCQSTQTQQPNTSSKSTQYKAIASKSKSSMVGHMNPAINFSKVSLRPKSSFASTTWKSQHRNGVHGSNSGLANPFLRCQNLSSSRTNSSFTSASWRTQNRSSISQTKSKYALLHSFPERYQALCERYMQVPIPGVKNHLSKGVLDLVVDRLKAEDWGPFLEALCADRELHKISIRSRYPVRKAVESGDKLHKVPPANRCPVIFSQYFLMGLTSALAHCLMNSNSLISLELEGIPLSPRYLSVLIEGLVNSKHLKHLSFEKCFIGDDGLGSICKALRHLPGVLTLNVSACGITAAGIGHIVSLLKFQKMNQYIETWQQSLRYQIPNLDSMSGLRRITLNHNPSIGDEGVTQLCDILDDDLWVRAIDLQRSGVGQTGAINLISLLHLNVTLAVVDIRENKNVPSHLLKKIMQLLMKNNKDRNNEYQWIALSSTTNLGKDGKACPIVKKGGSKVVK